MNYSDILERLEQFTESYLDYYEESLTATEVAAIRHFYYEMLNDFRSRAITALDAELNAVYKQNYYLPHPKV